MNPHEQDRQRRLLALARVIFGDGVMLMRNGARMTFSDVHERDCMVVVRSQFPRGTGHDVAASARSWAKLEALLTRTERIPATLP